MPMFPLGCVLLPGAVLPLHVFEPRYRALVVDCLAADDHEFGVTMIERGSDVGGGDQRMGIGTVAKMLQVAELADGRYALVCVGTRRIRVNAWLADDPYPLADVDDLPDDDPDAPHLAELLARMTARVRRSSALAVELGDSGIDPGAEVSSDPLVGSYQLASLAPIGPADAYRLLVAGGPEQRLDLLDALLDDVDAVQQFRLMHDDGQYSLDDPEAP
jgi:Lon protease-like protein